VSSQELLTDLEANGATTGECAPLYFTKQAPMPARPPVLQVHASQHGYLRRGGSDRGAAPPKA